MSSHSTHQSHRSRTARRFRGERGIAIIITSLVLIPLMVFAAFGVDVASFYSRASQLQRAADAAALAGTVWMPSVTKASDVATESLRKNGLVPGQDGITVTYGVGSTKNSFRVVITDANADTYLSNVIGHKQQITRSAEAEYNIPLPLGSPLNYFGGDRSKVTVIPASTTYAVTWPIPYNNPSTWRPVAGTNSCNVGTLQAQGFGSWSNLTTYSGSGWYSSGTRCQWSVRTAPGTGTTTTSAIPPSDYSTREPDNPSCTVRSNGQANGSILGRWFAVFGSPVFTTSGSFGNPAAVCVWTTTTTGPPTTVAGSVPSFSQTLPPLNQPCNVGLEASYGRWANGTWTTGVSGSTLCRWYAQITTTTIPEQSEIAADRNPGFWAAISGPGGVATQGNAYSVRCTDDLNTCSTANRNTMYRDTGFWYVVKMPASGASQTSIRIFDASYDINGTGGTNAGDNRDTGTFDVEYRVYKQTNPLDINVREPTPGQPGAGNTTLNSCWWKMSPSDANTAAFGRQWEPLCTLTPNDGDTYLVNVKTSSSDGNGAGINGYALEALSVGTNQPAVYAYADMGMYNNIATGTSTFYLAEVGPQYAGKTLVLDLWDSGDADGVARLTPMKPASLASGLPKPVVPVASTACTYEAYTPNPRHDSSQYGGATSPAVAAGTRPSGTDCTITTANQTSTSGTPRNSIFNDEWLSIRIDIPLDYTCTVGRNPELEAGTCWWGIRYTFSHGSTDATTWGARVEGNPVHLTQ